MACFIRAGAEIVDDVRGDDVGGMDQRLGHVERSAEGVAVADREPADRGTALAG